MAHVVTALLVEQCRNNTVIMAEQCCSTNNNVQQRLFTVVETGENNIDRKLVRCCSVLMVEQCCNNIVIMAEQPCSLGATQHGSQLSTTLFTPVDNLQQVVRFSTCVEMC